MKFTIIIPAYNSSKFIQIPLDSLEKQNFEDFEVLIINDGSTDNTIDVVKPYIERNVNWKIITKKNGNWGSVINFVKNNNLINGEYVTILDSDDYMKNDALKVFSENLDSDIVLSKIYFKNNKKTKAMSAFIASRKNINLKRKRTPVSMPHGKFYKKELFLSLEDLEEGISYQDTVLYNSLASKAKSIFYIKKPLVVWWQTREGNSTTVAWNQKRIDVLWKTFQNNINIKDMDNEIYAWILMYIWDVKRNIVGNDIVFPKLEINLKKVKFLWLPFGTRKLAKMYFVFVNRKYFIKKSK